MRRERRALLVSRGTWCRPETPPTQIDNRAIVDLHSKETAIPFITRLEAVTD
ncbi:hypothetical protein [Natronomonas sp. LN261]|uniref:hypothetical protein n=1 Tax=Natronomonas sp. LN261 TaxID=2750669 RepID=UPI0015EE59F8|nr:hypothetical protein [Natronomonas sp. LN261]